MADLIVFGEDWGRHPSSTQHLITHLMKQHRVIWVNSIGMRSPNFSLRDISRLFSKALSILKSSFADSDQLDDGIQQPHPLIVHPTVLPFHQFEWVSHLNRRLLLNTLTPIMEKQCIVHPVLWLSLPTAVNMVGHLNESAVLYYCGDDFGALDGVDHDTVLILEKTLAQQADAIIVVSDHLEQKFNRTNTLKIPHGCDYTLFATPMQQAEDQPRKGPIAGFYGNVAPWLDTEMIAQAATALPHWQFVFIGSIKTDVSNLTPLPNVHMLGPRPHHQLPSYLQHWDVAMLPFKQTPQIQSCNPLKLREYLASGTAIASTDFPAVREYESLVSIKRGREPFFKTIMRAYGQQNEVAARQHQAAQESWQYRSEQIDTIMADLIAGDRSV